MARFCGNCGAQLEDNAKVCGQCGTPLDGTTANIPGLKITDPEKQAKAKKTVKRIVSLAALIIAAVIVFSVASQHTGYNGLLRKVMNAYEDYDIDTLVSLSSDVYFYEGSNWVEYYFENAVDDDLGYFESYFGSNYKFSYEINEITTVSEYMLDNIRDKIESSYSGFDASTIDKIVVANITITAKQSSVSESRDIDIAMSNEGGSWKLLYIE